jgi:hypothetical protein
MVATVSARTVGVWMYDEFEYDDIVAYWYSTDPSATPDPSLEEINKTELYRVRVVGISGTNITLQMTMEFKNGSSETAIGYIDIDTGEGNMSNSVIGAGLNAGEPIYISSPTIINETIPRDYPGGSRLTNHLNMTQEYIWPGGSQHFSSNYYWDREIGIFVEMYVECFMESPEGPEGVESPGGITTWSVLIKITSSNRWVVPEYPTFASILTLTITFTAILVIYKRRLFKTLIR